jgi:NAD-dependent deacetylase
MNIVVFTGAGISAESGIPTFRDKVDGIWSNVDPTEVANIDTWTSDPQLVAKFHTQIRDSIIDKKPNSAHQYFADLEKEHDVTIITQNIDDLHEKAGSTNVIHLHGEINKVECIASGEVYEVDGEGVMYGKTSEYGGLLKPYTVLFGEYPNFIDEAQKALRLCDKLIIVGTGFDISYILPMISDALKRNPVPITYIDKDPSNDYKSYLKKVKVIKETATIGVKALKI